MVIAHTRDWEEKDKGIVLENKSVKVEKVHVSGLKRTKADYIVDAIKPVFACDTFLEAYTSAIECRNQLLSRGLFQSVDVFVDTTDAYENRSKDGIQVLFKVQERNVLCGEVKTEMSNHEKPRWVMRILSPNVFGRGETLSNSFSHTLTSNSVTNLYQPTDFSTTFSKPFSSGAKFQLSILKEKQEHPWSAYNECSQGIQTSYEFPLFGNRHNLEWFGHWRELSCAIAGNASFGVRKQMGHSLKSSIKHTVQVDKTDCAILPMSGLQFRLTEEVAGFGGDVNFIKETLEGSIHRTLLQRITLGVGFQGGFMFPFGKERRLLINDKFFVGGPLTLRGFEFNSVGKESSGCYLGSTGFWIVGGHIYTPLPFYWSRFGHGSFLDNLRLHFFANAGNSYDFTLNGVAENVSAACANIRASCGLGLVYKFMNLARLELNFCIPLRAKSTDKVCHGLQFGIGVSSV